MDIQDSSLLTSADWNTEDGLTVTFRSNGSQYVYPEVDFHTWSEFQQAASKGSFFKAYIQGKFEGKRL